MDCRDLVSTSLLTNRDSDSFPLVRRRPPRHDDLLSEFPRQQCGVALEVVIRSLASANRGVVANRELKAHAGRVFEGQDSRLAIIAVEGAGHLRTGNGR